MMARRLSENPHLPFDRLTALRDDAKLKVLSKVEGQRYPHPSSLRRITTYASFQRISDALHLGIFQQPLLASIYQYTLAAHNVYFWMKTRRL